MQLDINVPFLPARKRVIGSAVEWQSYFNFPVKTIKVAEDRSSLKELAEEAIDFCAKIGLPDPLIEDSFLNAFELLESIYGRGVIRKYIVIVKECFYAIRSAVGDDKHKVDLSFIQAHYGYEHMDVFFVALAEYLAFRDGVVKRQLFSKDMPDEVLACPFSRSIELIDGIFVGRLKQKFGHDSDLPEEGYRKLMMLSLALRLNRTHEIAMHAIEVSTTFEAFVLSLKSLNPQEYLYFTWRSIFSAIHDKDSPIYRAFMSPKRTSEPLSQLELHPSAQRAETGFLFGSSNAL